MTEAMISLGKTVRDRRQQLGLSQAHLAKKAGTNAAIIDFIEKASFRGVDPVMIRRLAEALALDGDQLIAIAKEEHWDYWNRRLEQEEEQETEEYLEERV